MGQLKDTQKELKELEELENELWRLEGNVMTSSDIERLLKIVKLDK